jgi:uncharacterized protein YijF (DUF1287 family)
MYRDRGLAILTRRLSRGNLAREIGDTLVFAYNGGGMLYLRLSGKRNHIGVFHGTFVCSEMKTVL